MSRNSFTSTKRSIDLCVSGIALTVLSPVLLAIAVLIKLTDRGPVIFRQVRAGRDGIPFEIWKFRTMAHVPTTVPTDAAGTDGAVAAYYWTDGVPEDFVFKSTTHSEQLITPPGRYLRRWSLDELPQFVNVWRGDMSLVGPRPELVAIAACYSTEQRRRLQVRPGITGWAQVNGRSGIDHGRKIAADLYYIDHASLWMDLRVLAKTVVVALSGRESY